MASTKALIKGIKLRKPVEKSSVDFTVDINSVIYDADGNENTTWDQVKVIGSMTASFEPDFAASISFSGIKEFKAVLITKNIQTLSVVAGGSIPLIDIKKPIATYHFAPITIYAPTPLGLPLPVVFVPEVTVYVGIKGEAGATLSTKVSMDVVYIAGVHYKNGEGWQPVSNYSRNFGFDPPSISAGAYIKGYISPEFNILLYNTAGPFASMEGYLKLEAGISIPPWWKLYGGIGASAGAKVKIISWTLAEYKVDLFNKEWEIASSATQNQSPIIASVTATPSSVSPNGTSTVTCVASDPDNDPLTYSWSTTGGSISGSGSTITWTAPSTAGTYTVTCTVSDGKGGSASKGVNITVSESTTPLSITPTSLPPGTVGVPYPATNVSATGGKTPYSWSWSGNTPPILSLSSSGVISGTPTTAGTYNFTVKVTDSSSPQQSDSKVLSIIVNPSGGYSISGRVTLNGAGLSGVTMTLTGATSTSTTTDSNGNYAFSGAANGNYTLTPSKSGYTFTPSSIPVTVNNANITGQDFTAIQSQTNYILSVNISPLGGGIVTGTGISCPGDCSESFISGSGVTLSASPNSGYSFSSWSGCDSPSGSTCSMTMNANKTVTATFNITTAKSDLIIQNLSVYPTSGVAGSSATVSFTIRNQGSGTANASTTNIRINTSSSGVTTSDPLLASISTPSIAVGCTYNVNQTVTIPSDRPAGTNYIWVIVDVNHTANQSDESNDKAYTIFTVTTSGCTPPSSFTLSTNAYCNTQPPVAPAVMLTWTTSSGSDYYNVYRNGTLLYDRYGNANITGTTFDNNLNVVAGQTYTYYIVARNSCGNTQSNTVPVTVPSNICPTYKEVTVANTSGIGVNLRSGPGISYTVITGLPEGTKMSVIGGPVQADGYTWWNITGSYGTGWSAVGEWLTPAPQVGITVTVTYTGGYGLRLRSGGGISYSVITTLTDGTQMTVFGGPVQADGYTWWAIQGYVGGTQYTGWSAVGNWLVPNPRY